MVRELSNLPPGCTDWDIEEQCREPGPCECGHSVEDQQDRTTATGKTVTGGGPCLECGPAPSTTEDGHSDEPECAGYVEAVPERPDPADEDWGF